MSLSREESLIIIATWIFVPIFVGVGFKVVDWSAIISNGANMKHT